MPFYYRVCRPGELSFITTSTYRRTRLLVAQALLPVPSGHSQEWLCHFAAWMRWDKFDF
jgi:hypothetical protein